MACVECGSPARGLRCQTCRRTREMEEFWESVEFEDDLEQQVDDDE
ncbi:hypothetical protein SAMN04487947_0426 [Halogeometricum rufum]|uniref:Uncharacterized protein n=1 Tax=Halogeometricum rufum TaxID=553469 RepID=A0A1I6G1V5_9EURY|nr:hypothetical protein [Halogeometricum rufum]SFR36158.1 hypothetical protein SAMN04487947_0426 [Halogeometricum rufum]